MISIRQVPTVIMVSLIVCSTVIGAKTSTDAFVFAEFRPGGTCDDCFGWRVTILQDGRLIQEVKDAPGWGVPDEWTVRRTLQLSTRRIARLKLSIQGTRFSNLRNQYSANYDLGNGVGRKITDQETDIIAIRLDGNIKRVSVYGPEAIAGIRFSEDIHPDREAGKRFIAVWAEILTLVPSPNSWQKARAYR